MEDNKLEIRRLKEEIQKLREELEEEQIKSLIYKNIFKEITDELGIDVKKDFVSKDLRQIKK